MRRDSLKQLVGFLGVAAPFALLILVAFGGAATARAQEVSFIARRDFAAGTAPFSVAVGDGGAVSVLINNTPRK